MKKTLFWILCIGAFHAELYAQKLSQVLPESATTYAAISTFADSFFAATGANQMQYNNVGVAEESDYIRYKRWQYYWENRIMPDGSWPDVRERASIYSNLQGKKTRGGTWENFSQTTTTSGYNGMGRVLCVAFHPTNANIMYVTAPRGGVWKTTDGGNTWSAKGDGLPTLYCGNIVIDETQPNTLYITLNDNTYWDLSRSLGIYKSTDGGDTWLPTGLNYSYADNNTIRDLCMLSNNANVVASAQSNGLFVSTDAGATWTQKLSGYFTQVINKANSNTTFYAMEYNSNNGLNKFYQSTDSGNTWNIIQTFSINTRNVNVATTLADTNFLAILFDTDSARLYTSNDAGINFTAKGVEEKGDYIGISGLNKNRIYMGAVSSYRSVNGGASFTKLSHWYNDGIHPAVHADAHYYACHPITKEMYYCNDGGIYKYNESTETFKDLSNGLIITQFYKCAISQVDSTWVSGGTQDNGGRQLNNGTWEATNGGDAMEVAMDIVDGQTGFSTYVEGNLYRTENRWISDVTVTPDPNDLGSWVTPYVVHGTNEDLMVAGYSKVYKSDTKGLSWTPISNFLAGSDANNLDCIAIARSNVKTIYTTNGSRLYYTYTDGATWQNKNTPDGNSITEIAIHPTNDKVIYFTKSGYSANKKVYKSVDGGISFINISYNLPNVPHNTIIVDQESDSTDVDMYIGTDVGVFYKKDSDTTWTYYGTGIPNTEISDLQIQYKSGILVASTYGRGLFKNRIQRNLNPVVPTSVSNTTNNLLNAQMVYDNGNVFIVLPDNAIFNGSYKIMNANAQILKNVIVGATDKKIKINTEGLTAGNYFVQINNAANTRTIQFTVVK